MKTTTLILSAIIAALSFTANAENISGAMYLSPVEADTNHPAPTTGYAPPYGRVNIDTTDQNHIATTAYVKGAYNSAIAAVNNVANDVSGKQDQLVNFESGNNLSTNVVAEAVMDDAAIIAVNGTPQEKNAFRANQQLNLENSLVTAGGVVHGMDALASLIESKIDGEKQDKLINSSNDEMLSVVLNEGALLGEVILGATSQEYSDIKADLAGGLSSAENFDLGKNLISAGSTLDIVRGAGEALQANIDTVQTALNNKRVEIYTIWDDDTAKQQVAFVNAPAQQ